MTPVSVWVVLGWIIAVPSTAFVLKVLIEVCQGKLKTEDIVTVTIGTLIVICIALSGLVMAGVLTL